MIYPNDVNYAIYNIFFFRLRFFSSFCVRQLTIQPWIWSLNWKSNINAQRRISYLKPITRNFIVSLSTKNLIRNRILKRKMWHWHHYRQRNRNWQYSDVQKANTPDDIRVVPSTTAWLFFLPAIDYHHFLIIFLSEKCTILQFNTSRVDVPFNYTRMCISSQRCIRCLSTHNTPLDHLWGWP